jgi:hypothetical protein
MIKHELDLPSKSMRVFNHIFNDKQKNKILDEALYFSNIYTTILVQYSINKYIKIKIYKRTFTDIHKSVDEFHSVVLADYHKNH